MENLEFKGAFIPCHSDLMYCADFLSFSNEQIWCLDNTAFYNDNYDRAVRCYYFSKDFEDYCLPDLRSEYSIHPIVRLSGLALCDFYLGDTFYINHLPFFIYDSSYAISTEPIGSFAWEDDECVPLPTSVKGASYIYGTSSLRRIVQDWFDCFVKDEQAVKYMSIF